MPPFVAPQPLTFNQQLFDALVRHQIGLLQFSGGVRNKVWKLLDATEGDLRARLNDGLRGVVGEALTPARIRRIEQTLRALRETRVKAWDQVDEVWFDEMQGLALAEPDFVAGIMQSTFPVDLGMSMPDPMRLKAIVESRPFMGQTLEGWASTIRQQDLARIEQQIRIGLVQGEDIPSISRRLVGTLQLKGADGVTAITRRNAESITRTATNSISAESRRELYTLNEDLLSGELFVATLDSKTTPICRSLDGKIFPVGKAPVLPLHWGERSAIAPVVDGEVIGERPMRNFTEQGLLREYAEKNGLDKVPKKRKDLPRGTKGDFDEFARKRMRELTGTAPATLSYQEWLSGQSAAFQDDILGPTRGALFREGGLKLEKFVMPEGSQFTLDELAQREAAAFKAAGIDPVTLRLPPAKGGAMSAPLGPLEGETTAQALDRLRKVEIQKTLESIQHWEEKKPGDLKQAKLKIAEQHEILQQLLNGELDGQIAETNGIKIAGAAVPPPVPVPTPSPKKLAAKKPGGEMDFAEMGGEDLQEALAEEFREEIDELEELRAEADARGEAYMEAVSEFKKGSAAAAPNIGALADAAGAASRALEQRFQEVRGELWKRLAVKDGIDLGYTPGQGVPLKKPIAAKVDEAMEFLSKVVSKDASSGLKETFDFKYNRIGNNDRAYAMSHLNSVFLSDSNPVGTIVHEIGHLIEVSTKEGRGRIAQRALDFLKMRGRRDPRGLQKLASIFPQVPFEADEIAYQDEFVDAYMGKYYSDEHATEIISMGLQMLYENPLRLLRRDPEMFSWLIDTIRGF